MTVDLPDEKRAAAERLVETDAPYAPIAQALLELDEQEHSTTRQEIAV